MKRGMKPFSVITGVLMIAILVITGSALAKTTLNSGQILYQGEKLTSPNGKYTLVLQNDGNLVLYERGHARWSAGTNGKNAKKLVMQSDGNLVLYGPNGPVWASNTSGNRRAFLMLQDDGNLVIYKAVWSTGSGR